MNKKLVIFIVSLVIVFSVIIVAFYGSESYGGFVEKKVEDIFFVKKDGSVYEDYEIIYKTEDVSKYEIDWIVRPLDAVDKTVIVYSNKPDVEAEIEGGKVVVIFNKHTDVEITIVAEKTKEQKTIKFMKFRDQEGDPL